MTSAYQLSASERVWTDGCDSCPAYIEFQDSTKCGRQSAVDGRCFRGDWAQDNDWFAYHFQFPPEWSSGSVDFVYTFKYWALGSWENEKGSKEFGGSAFCAPTESMAAITCTDEMDQTRLSKSSCEGWSTWTASSGSFDPYSEWQASDGDGGGQTLACFLEKSYSRTDWAYDTLTVAFWTWDYEGEGKYGISGPLESEAWVVSDFSIEFTPPPFSTVQTTDKSTTTTQGDVGDESSNDNDSNGNGWLLLVIIVIGAMAVLCTCVALCLWCRLKKERKKNKTPAVADTVPRNGEDSLEEEGIGHVKDDVQLVRVMPARGKKGEASHGFLPEDTSSDEELLADDNEYLHAHGGLREPGVETPHGKGTPQGETKGVNHSEAYDFLMK